MTYRPCGYRVLVRLKEVEEVTESGIIVHTMDSSKREQAGQIEATIVELGKDAFTGFGDGTPWCKVGDKVLIARYSGTLRDDTLSIINDEDILSVIED